MSLENLKLEIEKKKNRSEERYHRYLDNDYDLPCIFSKFDIEEIRKNTYEEILDMIEKEQAKEQSSNKEEFELDER